MKLSIENIGIIRKAEVEINGLTVIAGENDTGKSTVGKLLFSIVKAISRYEQDLNESKDLNITRNIEKLYFEVRRLYDINSDKEFKAAFFPPSFLTQLKPYFDKNHEYLFSLENELEKIFHTKEILIGKIEDKNKRDTLLFLLHEIKTTILLHEAKETVIKRALERALYSEFYGEISPKNNNKYSSIICAEGNNKILNIGIENNNIKDFVLHDLLSLNDVTLIETPILLQMYDLIRTSSTLFENQEIDRNRFSSPKISLHIKDLINKIDNAKYYANFKENTESVDILNNISTLINGGFDLDDDKNDFIFSKHLSDDANMKIRAVNTASGIKAFGIIQLLLKASILDERSLLIIDEPENHLHPKWQIAYAEIIVLLVKNNINIIINSHSPYMIQAINFFSKKYHIEDKTKYYLAEFDGKEQIADITDVTNDLNRIFIKLAEPLHALVWK